MNVSLTVELEEFVNDKVKNGLYSSASEVIHEGLLLLKEQDQLRFMQLTELEKAVRKGVSQLGNGQFKIFTSSEDLIAHIKTSGRNRLASR